MNGLLVIDVFGSLRGNKSADDLDSVEHVNKYAVFVVLRFLYRFPTVGSFQMQTQSTTRGQSLTRGQK